MSLARSNAAVAAPAETTRVRTVNGQPIIEFFEAFADGSSGYYGYYGNNLISGSIQSRKKGKGQRPKLVKPSAESRKVTEGTTEPVNVQPRQSNTCERFALSLVHQLYNAMVQGWNNPENFRELGSTLVNRAIANRDKNNHVRNKGVANETPFDGFKNELVGNFDKETNSWNFEQRSDVFHHIEFSAGSVLHSNGDANPEGWALWWSDIWGRHIQGRTESAIEIRDDHAGWAVGNAMLETARQGQNGDYNGSLYNQIRGILCQ